MREILRLQDEIDDLISLGNAARADARLAELWFSESSSAAAPFVISRYEKLRGLQHFSSHRLAILRSFTIEPVIPLLRASAFTYGIDLSIHVGDFNTYAQEILDPNSSLYKFQPQAVILAVQARDVTPELWTSFADLSEEAIHSSIARVSRFFENSISAFRQHSTANLIVHSFEAPETPALGVLDAQSETGQSAAIQQINRELRRICAANTGVYLLDYSSLIARYGWSQWHDERKWLTARMPIRANHLNYLAQEWLRFLVPLTGRSAKVLALDLDNTLWGGVIGEDGLLGIRLSPEYPGAAYQALQRALLDLRSKGILLAVCSKNNLDEAMEAISTHPAMLLKPEHFAATRINWNDKSQNLREIASELNLGTDAVALLDDNPVERAQVRSELPEIMVVDLPEDPFGYAHAVRDCPFFERLTISAEDRHRGTFYAAERDRVRAEQNFADKEDFYRSLEQTAEIEAVSPTTLARVAQLTQKTNQFNLTTRRYNEQQIMNLAATPGSQVLSIRVRDRYGDHGLVGVAIFHDSVDSREIDTFLLSCRVIGRTVESAFLSHLVENARAKGLRYLRGCFIPTKRNAPAQTFYTQHGFVRQSGQDGEPSVWSLDLREKRVACPEWIELRALAGETA